MVQNAMENQDLAPHSEESQGSHPIKKVKQGLDPTRATNMEEQADEAKSTKKKSEIKCYKCKEYGHKCSACPNRKIRKQGEAHPHEKNKTRSQAISVHLSFA